MALRNVTNTVPQDENAEIYRGKAFLGKEVIERKTLSNITNTVKKTSATPVALQKENRQVASKGLAVNHQNGKGLAYPLKTPLRTPLGDITNGTALKSRKTNNKASLRINKENELKNSKAGRAGSNKGELDEETKHKVDVWAREGIEKSHFTGKDIDCLRNKAAEQEIDRNVEAVLSYKTEIPYFLPRAFEQEPLERKEKLELDDIGGLDHWPVPSYVSAGQKASSYMNIDFGEEESICIDLLDAEASNWNPRVRDSILW